MEKLKQYLEYKCKFKNRKIIVYTVGIELCKNMCMNRKKSGSNGQNTK